eukprot:CAMPEP_0194141802 /NCGR_PEP_ID=MMETSP0152-20130528/11177_1 /TAXON_ID=1049557 /ORGANISM="Thalassiothrix antarctica, Strain L6-D1" /LENGTH=371 /DNA_ID=CAMNT_0038840545 /DNA_START=20 /DNA_END=1135 /DNA_ORIENTATION=+
MSNDNNSSAEKTEAIWTRDDDHDWDLTYNVWHMLPWMERKAMADNYGYKTIGEFEEYLSLRRAVGETEEQKPYPNEEAYNNTISQPQLLDKSNSKIISAIDEEEDDNNNESGSIAGEEEEANPDDALPVEELLRLGGQILKLPEELVHGVFSWLPVDAYATLALVSPHWKHLTRTEAVYHMLCRRIYLNQAKRRTMNVSHFGGSYLNMLYNRPRVRTGLYVMKFSEVKKIQRDMWCEIPVGAILENVYYRYILFLENGTVLYALVSAAPHEMVRRLLKILRTGGPDRAVVHGNYIVKGTSVTVTAKQEWQHVKFNLTVQPNSHWGRFGALSFDRHLSSKSGNFDEYVWPNDITEYKVPHEVFRYLIDKRLN